MQKELSIYLTVLFLDIRNLIPKEMLKSFSSPRDKQVAPDAIVKTNWTKCAICQQNKVEPLQCSARIPSTCVMLDLGTRPWLEIIIAKFRDHDSMPMQIDLSPLDEGDALENTLVRCKARCHKRYYDLFNSQS